MNKDKFLYYFGYGFILSLPLSYVLYIGFYGRNMSNFENSMGLLFMTIVGILSLPGSLVLFLAGFAAAFMGKTGEIVAGICILLSIPNAHLMGMLYAYLLLRKRRKVVELSKPK